MSAPEVVVVPTGTANLASVRAALDRLGARARLAESAAMIEDATHVVLPGVGSFGAAVAGLREAGFDEAVAARVRAGRATLAMCVGLQVLFEASDESPHAIGLAVLPGRVGRFPDAVRVPQFGWNRVVPEPGCRLRRARLRLFRQQLPRARGAGLRHRHRRARRPLRRRAGAGCACSPASSIPELSGAYGHRLIARWLEARC